jgi:TRAP-type C4-dicarboxylate transport system permease small subunit
MDLGLATESGDGSEDVRMINVLKRIDTVVGWILRTIAVLAFVGLFVVLAGNIFFRWMAIGSMLWFEEVVSLFFAYLVFVAAAEIWRIKAHFKINWIEDKLQGTLGGDVVRVIIDCMAIVFLAYLTWYGWRLTTCSRELTPLLKFPKRWMYFSMPSSGLVMFIYSIRDFVEHVVALINRFRGVKTPAATRET